MAKYCPVCKNRIMDGKMICPNCGYDESCDYEQYNSLGNIPNGISAMSERIAAFEEEIARKKAEKDTDRRIADLEEQLKALKEQREKEMAIVREAELLLKQRAEEATRQSYTNVNSSPEERLYRDDTSFREASQMRDIPLDQEEPAVRSVPINRSNTGNSRQKSKTSGIVIGVFAVVCLAAVLLWGGRSSSTPEESAPAVEETIPEEAADPTETAEAGISGNVNVGDMVSFGHYEQDANTSNGQEAITWKVLDVQDGKALLISEYALEAREYNTSYTPVTWETCTLRTWLNEEFINTAFTGEEAGRIAETTVTADANPRYDMNPGNDTTDRIFLLSIMEANKYFQSDDIRMCVPTAYAIEQGAYTSSGFTVGGKATCWWWLRSPGNGSTYAAFVDSSGGVDDGGGNVSRGFSCVRPALWVNLES